jgi:hypothetical protein
MYGTIRMGASAVIAGFVWSKEMNLYSLVDRGE